MLMQNFGINQQQLPLSEMFNDGSPCSAGWQPMFTVGWQPMFSRMAAHVHSGMAAYVHSGMAAHVEWDGGPC